MSKVRYLTNIFKLKKSVSVRDPVVHFTLKISASQNLKPMLLEVNIKTTWPKLSLMQKVIII